MIKLKHLLTEDFKKWNSVLWVHYSNADFLRNRSQNSTGTPDPMGIYMFPLRFNFDLKRNFFMTTSRNKSYIKIVNDVNIFDIGTKNKRELDKILYATNIKSDEDLSDVLKDYCSYATPEQQSRIKSFFHIQDTSPLVYWMWWRILREFFRRESSEHRNSKWSKLFQNFGYDGIFDDVECIGGPSEGKQLVIFDPDNLKIVKQMENDRNPNVRYKKI